MPDTCLDSGFSAVTYDVIIIGGGPAGSSAATTLAKAGRRVLVLEKMKFPRFHVGESLLPYNRKIFDELGLWPKIESAGFITKRGAQFLMGDGSRKVRLNFSRGAFTEFPQSVQVERSKFDKILLDHSASCGAEVREEAAVTDYKVHETHVSICYQTPEGEKVELKAAFLIDASGLTNFTANRESRRDYYPGHKKIAIFGHFEGLDMPQGEEHGDILIVRRENSWFWLIPLEDNKTSVGLVLDAADFKAMRKEPQQVFDLAVADTRAVSDRFDKAMQLTPLHVVTDFSYTNDKLVSPRMVRVGDASGFIDPIFSSGVLLAMESGQQGAQAVHEALSLNQPLSAGMKRYEKDNRRRISQFWQFIENFYKVHFAQLFFQPNNRFRVVCAVNAVLAGCTKLPFAVRWRLRVFFLLGWLNKYIPITERIKIN